MAKKGKSSTINNSRFIQKAEEMTIVRNGKKMVWDNKKGDFVPKSKKK